MARMLAIVSLILSCAILSAPGSAAAVLYAADGAAGNLSHLVILNPNTGAVVSTVGSIGFAVTGLAVHPGTGVLYGATSFGDPTASGALITINKSTGAGTLVGSFGLGGDPLPDLTFTNDGTLYGWARFPNALHRVNLTTGRATRVGTFNIGTNFPGLGLAATSTGLILGTSGLGPLFEVNPNTGIAVAFTNTDWTRTDSGFGALAFGPGGVLYGMAPTGVGAQLGTFLATIALPSGHVTEIGRTIDQGDAIAFDPPVIPDLPITISVPTLSEVAFAAMAVLLTAVAVYRLRRQHA
jgi:hypothetical protein